MSEKEVPKRTQRPTVHPKVIALVRIFEHFARFSAMTGKKPNRAQRRAATIGVKIGKNRPMTKARKASGSLRRSRMTLV